MGPLRIVAHLSGHIQTPDVMLDGLLGAAIARREGLPPLEAQHPEQRAANCARVLGEIPLQRSACGRIFLCSAGQSAWDRGSYETRHQNRRFPVEHAAHMTRMRRVDSASGPQKTYRIPRTIGHVEGDQVAWYAIGLAEQIEPLLHLVPCLGKRWGLGNGHVARWEVTSSETWEGFPVLRDGMPLRALPLDWPGLVQWSEDYRVLLPPYWQRHREEVCACRT